MRNSSSLPSRDDHCLLRSGLSGSLFGYVSTNAVRFGIARDLFVKNQEMRRGRSSEIAVGSAFGNPTCREAAQPLVLCDAARPCGCLTFLRSASSCSRRREQRGLERSSTFPHCKSRRNCAYHQLLRSGISENCCRARGII